VVLKEEDTGCWRAALGFYRWDSPSSRVRPEILERSWRGKAEERERAEQSLKQSSDDVAS